MVIILIVLEADGQVMEDRTLSRSLILPWQPELLEYYDLYQPLPREIDIR